MHHLTSPHTTSQHLMNHLAPLTPSRTTSCTTSQYLMHHLTTPHAPPHTTWHHLAPPHITSHHLMHQLTPPRTTSKKGLERPVYYYCSITQISCGKKAVMNIQNSDNKYFMWSILAALHPISRKLHPERVHHCGKFQNELNSITLHKIATLEKRNSISISVIGFENKVLFPISIRKECFDYHVDLLLYSEGDARHYCLIKDLNKLLYSRNRHKARMFCCRCCFHGCIREDLLAYHEPHCSQHGPQHIHRALYFSKIIINN